jgi:hypothetical protein
MRLSWLIHAHPEISLIKINPFRVLPKGVCALDVRLSS